MKSSEEHFCDMDQIITDLEKRFSKLSVWEQDFVKRMRKKFVDNGLTEKQTDILEDIWEKVT